MNFISRLLEEEGIFYYFEHTADKHNLVLTDKPAGYPTLPKENVVSMAPVHGAVVMEEDFVKDIEQEVKAISGKIALTDYNFQTPSTNLLSNSEGSSALGKLYDYPGRYEDRGGGDNYSGIRLEEDEAMVKVVRGISTCRAFTSGYKFELKNHYSRPLNTTYLLTQVSIEMSTNAYYATGELREEYKNKFEGIPATVQFRPARLTPKPVISGVQLAVVVGPSGEEIYSDKYGRVKVQFFWDQLGKKNENSSCWMRVSQDWAGKQWGSVFIPRMGQEVLVDFLEGDPDRPVITGRVYNAEQMPPYTLPDNQTQSGVKSRSSKGGGSSNYNEFRFEDKMGDELITLHAEKDLTTVVEHDESWEVQHDRTTLIKNNETQTVDEGNETLTLNQGSQTTTIKQGNQSTTLNMGNQSTKLDMGNQDTKLSMGNQSTKLDLGAASHEAMQSITLTVGQSKITVDQMGVTIEGMMIKINGQIQVQIQGIMTQMSGSAMVQISGGIIMIG
jgi:type VI secretion system secreted protein VgrG